MAEVIQQQCRVFSGEGPHVRLTMIVSLWNAGDRPVVGRMNPGMTGFGADRYEQHGSYATTTTQE